MAFARLYVVVYEIADVEKWDTLVSELPLSQSRPFQVVHVIRIRLTPSRWDNTHLRLHLLDLIVAGEPKVHEPLPVNQLCHLFQNSDPACVVLDQVVVSGQDGGDLALDGKRRVSC